MKFQVERSGLTIKDWCGAWGARSKGGEATAAASVRVACPERSRRVSLDGFGR